jgi:N-acetylmuramoyl-L-alanine amidase
VRDIQRRLIGLGCEVSAEEHGSYGPSTEAAVCSFQERRGLRVDGICGPQTWGALVEASYHLGDRMLYRAARPMLRGDDVADLQRRLGALGFDAGRVDGIFGERTDEALADFQRNAGLTVDRICGPATVRALLRVGERGEPVAGVRERQALLERPQTVKGLRVVVAEGGGLGALARAVERELAGTGAEVTVLHHPDGSEQAASANAVGAEAFVGLVLDPAAAACSTAFYVHPDGWASPGGRRLAELTQGVLPTALGVADAGTKGMSIPVLRETRMPAVVCELGPAGLVVERSAQVAAALGRALVAWAATPCD